MLKRGVQKTLSVAVVALLPFFMAACAKDMNQNDYRQKAYREDLAKLKQAEGVYTGTIASVSSGKHLGALKIILKTGTRDVPTSDPTKSESQPILGIEMEFLGAGTATIKAVDSFYDSGTGVYRATIQVKRQSPGPNLPTPPDSSLFVNGSIGSDGTFNGTIDAMEGSTGQQGFGGQFQLLRNGPDIEKINKAVTPDPDVFFTQQNFAGKFQFLFEDDIIHKKPIRNANLVLLKQNTRPEEDFLSIFLPTKQVYATLNFADGVKIFFPNGLLDLQAGTLTGDASINQVFSNSTGSKQIIGTLKLSCARLSTGGGFHCGVTTNSSPTVVADGKFTPSSGEVKEPTEESEQSRTIVSIYKGRGLFPDAFDLSKRKWKDVLFSAILPSRTRLEEILDFFLPLPERFVSVSMTFPKIAGVSAPFASVRYDITRRTLEAVQDVTAGGIPARETLSCENFSFVKTDGPDARPYRFKCSFVNSSNNIEIPLELSSN
jgi:hypothetical protein